MTLDGIKFPRGLGNPTRRNYAGEPYIARCAEDIQTFIEDNDYINCYTTVYAFTTYDDPLTDACNAVIDCIAFDFDAKDLNIAMDDAKRLTSWAFRHGLTPRVRFSGGKGFHVLLDFPTVTLNNPKTALRQFCIELSAAAEFKTVDTVTFGDLNRLIRLPNTLHGKSRLYCICLNAKTFLDQNLEDILELARTPQVLVQPVYEITSYDIIHALMSHDTEQAQIDNSILKESKLARLFVSKPVKHCRAVDYLIAYGVDEGARDTALAGIIQYYNKLGMSRADILKQCLKFNDKCGRSLRRSHIEYKLNYHMAHSYNHCSFLSNVSGVCDGCNKRG